MGSCIHCGGSGMRMAEESQSCSSCGGSGRAYGYGQTCIRCGGSGTVTSSVLAGCFYCGGTGDDGAARTAVSSGASGTSGGGTRSRRPARQDPMYAWVDRCFSRVPTWCKAVLVVAGALAGVVLQTRLLPDVQWWVAGLAGAFVGGLVIPLLSAATKLVLGVAVLSAFAAAVYVAYRLLAG